tara:strand:+ start:98 stop:436 length:339 start_codon:yes stop_codon:yes gene_type:complete
MSNRYDDRKVYKNDNEIYDNLLERRDVKFIRQYGTPNMKYPTIAQLRELTRVQHVWRVGDRFYKLAARYYSAPEYWWVIAQYNKRPTESDLSAGDVIYIPLPLSIVLGFYLR